MTYILLIHNKKRLWVFIKIIDGYLSVGWELKLTELLSLERLNRRMFVNQKHAWGKLYFLMTRRNYSIVVFI